MGDLFQASGFQKNRDSPIFKGTWKGWGICSASPI